MRLLFQYCTGTLQKRTERIQIPQDADTDTLFRMISKKVNVKASQLNITFRREGYILRVIKGWDLDFYQIKEGGLLKVEQRESETETQKNYRTKMFYKMGMKGFRGANNNLSVLNEQEEQDIDSSDDEEQITLEKQDSQDPKIKKFINDNLLKLLTQTKQGNENQIKEILENIEDEEDDDDFKQQIQKALVNQNGSNGWNSLHFAVFQGNFQIVQLFLEKGADTNYITSDGWSPLQLAIYRNHMEIVKLLLKQESININQITTKGTALHYACKIGASQYLKVLFENKVDPSIQNEEGHLPFNLSLNNETQEEFKKQNAKQQQSNQNQEQQFIPGHSNTGGFSPGDLFQPQLLQRTGHALGTPIRPPIVKGMAFKHGNWTLTLRTRYYVLNPDQGTIVRYKLKNHYPMKPMEVIPLNDVSQVKLIDRSWYMKGNIHYFEFYYNQQTHQMGFQYPETARRWVFFFKESISYARHFEEMQSSSMDTRQQNLEANSEIELLDDPHKDELVSQPFVNFMLGKQNQKRPYSPPAKQSQSQNANDKKPVKVYYNNNEMQKNQKKSQESNTPKLPQLPRTSDENLQDNFSKSTAATNNNSNSQDNSSNIDLGGLETPEIKFDSFKILKQLGRGAFGKVFLCQKKDDQKIYALKALKKRQLIVKRQLKYAVTEANVLKMCDHPFVLKLNYAFQTPNYLYLALEYCSGGDLSLHLAQKMTFEEETAKFYIAELILAIEHIHSKDIVYRDLKPENILLDKEGHIKLADFGLSKDNVNDGDQTKSFCGSPAYLSPEMLNHTGAGKPSDIYGIGAVLYEMVTGDPPYYNDDIPTMYANIKSGQLKFPKSVSAEARDLIRKLLDRNPKTRLGVKSKQELKDDPFFKNIDWDKLGRKECTPPPIDLDFMGGDDEDEIEMFNANSNKAIFTDHDYTENNKRVNRVIKYTFARPSQ